MFTSEHFQIGQVVLTRNVNDMVAYETPFYMFVAESMERHCRCDWGDLCEDDKKTNNKALEKGYRLLSAYEHPELPKIWIITEADRSVTTVLFPDEY